MRVVAERVRSVGVIPNAGDHVERDVFGVPLFAVRDHDGRARVFRNACRHRGLALVEGPGSARALVCRYHGWTYRLDGSLAHVPHADGFPDLDIPLAGWSRWPATRSTGLIVIGPLRSPGSTRRYRRWRPSPTAARGATSWCPPTQLLTSSPLCAPMNWKVLVEQFLEGYHIRSTHRETFFPVQYDNLNVVETFGPNSRITYPYRNIESLRDRPESTWTVGRA